MTNLLTYSYVAIFQNTFARPQYMLIPILRKGVLHGSTAMVTGKSWSQNRYMLSTARIVTNAEK